MTLATSVKDADHGIVWTTIPARLDRLPWSRFHLVVVVALGITWILDGLEVTIVGALGPILQRPDTLNLSAADIGAAASFYVAGAVFGSLLFGWMTDRVGRKQIFFLTLGLYIVGVGASAGSVGFATFAAARFLTGVGIGGEYAAINSAIDELVPARLRGRVDLIVNATFWAGAALGSAGTMLMLRLHAMPISYAWRVLFGIGAILGLCVIGMRAWVPESPRWLMTHRRIAEAESIVTSIEAQCDTCHDPAPVIRIYAQGSFGLRRALRIMATQYRSRVLYVLILMVAQAFLYNAVFFTYGMVLTHYDHVAPDHVGLYLLPLALGNLAGPILLGPYFDTIGRRRMIAATYAMSAVLMLIMTGAFVMGGIAAIGQTSLWAAIFFFASAAASSAYLTASEIFPLEMRALAIALFYAGGTLFGGVLAPYAFSLLIGRGDRMELGLGYVVAAGLMLAAAAVAMIWGVDAEGRSLEDIAPPLGGADAPL